MKTLIIVLIIASFIQTTILPLDLVLVILICRAYIKSNQSNLYLSFAFGILISHLNLANLGFQSIVSLLIVQATQMLSKARLAGNPFLIMPVAFVFLSLSQLTSSLIGYQTLSLPKLLLEAFMALPTLYLVRLWEERFIVRREIKLKV